MNRSGVAAGVTLLAFLAAACSSGSNDLYCPSRPDVVGMRINVSAVPVGTTLRICTTRCVTSRITAAHHPRTIDGPGYMLGTVSPAIVPMTLTATRSGHTRTSRVTIKVPQYIVKGCENYGGIGHATVTASLRLTE
jgi:hypothetical protein